MNSAIKAAVLFCSAVGVHTKDVKGIYLEDGSGLNWIIQFWNGTADHYFKINEDCSKILTYTALKK